MKLLALMGSYLWNLYNLLLYGSHGHFYFITFCTFYRRSHKVLCFVFTTILIRVCINKRLFKVTISKFWAVFKVVCNNNLVPCIFVKSRHVILSSHHIEKILCAIHIFERFICTCRRVVSTLEQVLDVQLKTYINYANHL